MEMLLLLLLLSYSAQAVLLEVLPKDGFGRADGAGEL